MYDTLVAHYFVFMRYIKKKEYAGYKESWFIQKLIYQWKQHPEFVNAINL